MRFTILGINFMAVMALTGAVTHFVTGEEHLVILYTLIVGVPIGLAWCALLDTLLSGIPMD